jgi:hypothetical protein
MIGVIRVLGLSLMLAGCAPVGLRDAPVPEAVPETGAAAKPEAPAPAPGRGLPGTTIASLGDVTQPGLWLRTPLVSTAMRGRVRDPQTGRAVVLDLIPLDAAPGAGSRMSLGAYQKLNLPLTALPQLRVSAAQ